MTESRRHFPLAALVGQERLKTTYLAAIVHPGIGGLLIAGPKGTGKSTAVHSVAALLPEYAAVDGCAFQCDPERPERYCTACRAREGHSLVRRPMRVVPLPLSCTEDRLIGSLQIETLLKEGRLEVQAGLLGEANRNILYVDEVNLLPDHLVDDILDAAATHWNAIEREGVSFSHATDFVLVGTMNPEEGELRPQILDRFPLCLRLETVTDADARVEIIRRNLLFEKDPASLHARFAADQERLRQAVLEARKRLPDVEPQDAVLRAVAASCAELKVDGQRPDIVIIKTACAIAALEAREAPVADDVLFAAGLALNHRTRDGGLLDPPSAEEIRETFARHLSRAFAEGPGRTKPASAAEGAAAEGSAVAPAPGEGGVAPAESPAGGRAKKA